MKMMHRAFFLGLGLPLFLQACAEQPISTDALPALKPGEGIAGISFDTTRPLKKVRFEDAAGSDKLLIDHVPFGQSAFLFVVPAGRYCIQHYSVDEYGYIIDTPPDQRCFDVEAGKISYSGTFVTHVAGETAGARSYLPGIQREDHPGAFIDALGISYPHIAAAAFPTGSDKSIAALAVPKTQPTKGVCGLLTQDEAAMLLGKDVQPGSEFYMKTIDACNFIHSSDESVHVLIYSGDNRASQFKLTGFEASATGATDWTAVPDLGEKATFGCKGYNCEIDILWQGRVLALVVDHNERKDIADALTGLAHQVFPRWQADPMADAGKQH